MEKGFLPVEDYLIKFAVDAYNGKYAQKIEARLCSIQSIRKTYNFQYGYRIDTVRGEDFVVIHLYFNPGPLNKVDIVRHEVIQNKQNPLVLDDEIYVVTGEVSDFGGIYKFPYIEGERIDFDLVYYMDDDYAMFMDGTPVLWTSKD